MFSLRILMLTVSALMALSSHAEDFPELKPPMPLAPETVALSDSETCVAWLSSAAPMREEEERLQGLKNRLDNPTPEALRKAEKNGSLNQRYYVLGNAIFERLVLDLASRTEAGSLETWLKLYVDPAVQRALNLLDAAKDIHATTPRWRNANPEAFQEMLDIYRKESEALGESYSYYVMIMNVLESVAAGRGVLDVATIKDLPSYKSEGSAHQANAKEKILYDLTDPEVVKLARTVIRFLRLPDDGRVPYPSLEVMKSIFAHNVYARLANAQWRHDQQNYASRPWIAAGQLLADIGLKVYGNEKLPPSVQTLLRTLSGLGNTDAKVARHMHDIMSLVNTSRFRDQRGNIVIFSSDYLLNLQIKKLTEMSASTSDQVIEMLVQVTHGSELLDEIMAGLAKKAGVKAPKVVKYERDGAEVKPVTQLKTETDVKPAAPVEKKVEIDLEGVSSVTALQLLKRFEEVANRPKDQLPTIPYALPMASYVQLRFALVQIGEVIAAYYLATNLDVVWNNVIAGPIGTLWNQAVIGPLQQIVQILGGG